MDITDSVAVEFLHTRNYLSSPTWSPDGRYLVYTSDDGTGINLHMLEVASGRIEELTSGEHPQSRPGLVARRQPAGLRIDSAEWLFQHLRHGD